MNTRERKPDESLKIAERLLGGFPEPSAILSIKGKIVVKNTRWEGLVAAYYCEMSFIRNDEFDFQSFLSLLDGPATSRFRAVMDGHEANEYFSLEDEGQRGGFSLTISISSLGISEELSYLISIRDDNESSCLMNALKDMAFSDPLSGFGNESSMHSFLTERIFLSKQEGFSFHVICIFLSGIKEITAMFGKKTSDGFLHRFSRRLAKESSEERLFRIMEDVFIIAMDSSERYTVSSMVSSLVSSLERPVFIGDTEILPSVLIGVCQFPADGESSDSLLSNCFSAAFIAKRKNLKWSFYC